jgi:hypothetical protein
VLGQAPLGVPSREPALEVPAESLGKFSGRERPGFGEPDF